VKGRDDNLSYLSLFYYQEAVTKNFLMKKILFVAAVITGSPLLAQVVLDSSAQLSEVVVTANRHPQKQNQTGKVMTVITREELSRSIGRTLPDLLNMQAGITVLGSQNNLGTNQDIFLQGASSGKTLILIDGVPAYDPSTISTAFDINHFSIDNIERIEIVRGAMSTLYGSDAIAGVINIITKKGGSKPVALYSTVAAGSFGTFKGVAGINGKAGKSFYNIQYSRLQSKGFSSAYDSTRTNNFDKDGFTQNIYSGNLSTSITDKLLLKLNGQAGKYTTDLDAGAFMDERDFNVKSANKQAGAGLEYRYGKGNIFANYNFNNSKRDYLDDSTHVGSFVKFSEQKYIGRSHVAEVYTNIDLSKKLALLIGTDYRFQNTDQYYSSVSSFGPYKTERGSDSTKMNQYSFFASVFLKNIGGFNIEAGSRYNNHSEYGDNMTYSFNPSFLINQQLKLFANIGSAFKVPSLYQLFVINSGITPLQPEKSRTIDGGVEYNQGVNGLRARALFFTREIRQGIDYSFVTNQYFNHNLQKDHGAEIEAGFKHRKMFFNANYTYVTGEVNTLKYQYNPANWSYEVSGDTTYNNLFRRPKHTVNVSAGYQPTEKFLINTHVRFAGKRFDPVFMGEPVELEGYHTIDLYSEYKLNPAIKVFADLKNITNEQFFDIRGFNSRRFNFMAGINVNL
jgi:vitamin B12 transporter